jgi:hypothetical protein
VTLRVVPPGLPDFSGYNIPKREKIYQMSNKYTNIFHSKTLQNLSKFGFFV